HSHHRPTSYSSGAASLTSFAPSLHDALPISCARVVTLASSKAAALRRPTITSPPALSAGASRDIRDTSSRRRRDDVSRISREAPADNAGGEVMVGRLSAAALLLASVTTLAQEIGRASCREGAKEVSEAAPDE